MKKQKPQNPAEGAPIAADTCDNHCPGSPCLQNQTANENRTLAKHGAKEPIQQKALPLQPTPATTTAPAGPAFSWNQTANENRTLAKQGAKDKHQARPCTAQRLTNAQPQGRERHRTLQQPGGRTARNSHRFL
jgi:hypothetical protein